MFLDIVFVILRTLFAIGAMYGLTKLLGKRQLSEMSMFGYISGISIGNIAAYIALEKDDMWLLALISLVLWVLVAVVLEYYTLKSKLMRKLIDSDRRMLISKGVVSKAALKKERLTVEELLEQLRDKDVFRIADVESASLEANGDLSVFLKAQHHPLTPAMIGLSIEKEEEPITFIVDGSPELDAMARNGLNLDWLEKQLAKVQLSVEQVFIAQYTKNKSLSLHTLDHRTLEVNLGEEDIPVTEFSKTELEQIKRSLLQAIAIIESTSSQSKSS